MKLVTIDAGVKIHWDKVFDIGIQRIDLEHRIFVDLLYSYQVALERGADSESILLLINEIEKYSEFHFISEENFMKQINYPYYERQRLAHFELLERLNIAKHRKDFSVGFLQFVFNWFSSHTMSEDKNIGLYVKEQNISVGFNYSFDLIQK